MKQLKKSVSFLLTLIMTFTLSITAFAAAEGNLDGGSITINDAVPGGTYKIYQLLYLESYDPDGGTDGKGAYAYKVNSSWKSWLKQQTQYVEIDSQDYVTWVENANAADFAKAALAYAESQGIPADGQETAPDAASGNTYSTVTFDSLKLGYYLADTSVGTLCSLNTTNPNAVIEEKNDVPTIEKEVQEDSTGTWGEENTAQIGDTIAFKTVITAQPGAEEYILHDEMSDGLTLDPDSIEAEADGISLTADDEFTVVISGLGDNCDFHVIFDQDYLDTINAETIITVTYNAVLNGDAEISADPNTNKTKLNYGEDSRLETTWDETKTYSFYFDIVKTKTDNTLLDGAKFELYDAKEGGNKIPLVKDSGGTYRVATKEEQAASDFVSAEIEAANGRAAVKGLDADTIYWLEETQAPAGYNVLAERVEVAIADQNLSTTLTGNTWTDGDGGIHIVNETGALLPTTGGMGTTLFYIGGGALMAGAAVIFAIKKHKENEE